MHVTSGEPESQNQSFSDSGELLTGLFHDGERGRFRRAEQQKRGRAGRSTVRQGSTPEKRHDMERKSATELKPKREQTAGSKTISRSTEKKNQAEKKSSLGSKRLIVVLSLAILAVPIMILVTRYAPLALTEQEQKLEPAEKEIIRGALSTKPPKEGDEKKVEAAMPEKMPETGPLVKREIQPDTPTPPTSSQPNDNAPRAEAVRESWSGSYPYSIYLGSFKTVDRAQKAVSVFQQKGVSPYWVKIDLGPKGVWFRVFAGHFKSRKEAEAFAKENNIPEGKSRHTRYANFIGTYPSEEELNKKSLTLFELGCYPYVITGTDGKYHLFTGAFYLLERAEEQQKTLASKGVNCQLVER